MDHNYTNFPSSSKPNQIAKYNADAGILADFENSGKSFNYTRSLLSPPSYVPEEQIIAYLSKIQRGGLVQPFGCMLAIDERTFRIISYSENCLHLMPDFQFESSKDLLGIDAKTLFTPSTAASLAKAVSSRDLTLLNPIWVYSRATQKPFYAILHRIDVGIVIDLEPAKSGDPALSLAGAVQSQKLAVRAISRLQSLPGGDIGRLCNTVVEDVQKLTGYDRVMAYKFHDDDHGEVVAEVSRPDLEPYLGLHYPATDIPQAARFLFKQNRVRMICDCNAKPVRVIQCEELKQPLCLVNSTIRSPHGCHTRYMSNMGSIASLVLAVIINGKSSNKLWGLVVCHHTSSRYVPFPLRYACEFLMQAFGLQIYMETQLASQLAEKKILKTQTLLCDMLLRDCPLGVVNQSPNIMDLVKCDGAVLYYDEKCRLLGVTPTEAQVKDIVKWLVNTHGDSTGLSTDSLADAGYPDAVSLGDDVCGMATAKISSKDFIFWFRSHTANQVKWGGAKHHSKVVDDGENMHPRLSFVAFLEVVKNRSFPWEISEINAIHSLQLIMRDSYPNMDRSFRKTLQLKQQNDVETQSIDELSSVTCEMVRLIETAAAPIFGVDLAGLVNGWNAKIAELTELEASEAMGKSLVNEIVHDESRAIVENIISRASQGEEKKDVELKLRNFGLHQSNLVVYIKITTCTSRDYKNNVIGVCFVGQDITHEKVVMDKFIRLQGDYKAIIESLNPLIPPIFASDENACCSEWNVAMENLTGWKKYEVIGKVLPGEIFGGYCLLKGQDRLTQFMIQLYRGISGQDTDKSQFGFFDRHNKYVEVLLTAHKRTDANEKVIGCFCFLQLVHQSCEESENYYVECLSKHKELTYIRQQIINPLSGIRFTHKLLETTLVSDKQKQFLETSDACEKQIVKMFEDLDLESVEAEKSKLNMEEFIVGSLLDAVVSQVMILMKEKSLQLFHEIAEEMKTLSVWGDQIRLQVVLSDLLCNVVHYAPSSSWVEIKISSSLKLQEGQEFINLQFRMSHPGNGFPNSLVQDMFENGNQWITSEGLGLNMSRNMLNRMNGRVSYVREPSKCYFVVDIEFKNKKQQNDYSKFSS